MSHSSISNFEAATTQGAPWGAIAAVVVILLGEAAFIASSEPLTGLPYLQPAADDAILAAKHALVAQSEGSVLLVGDSSCLFGLRPAAIRDECGEPVVNLGAMAFFSTAGFAAMVDEALSKETKPLAVVLVVYPETLARDANDARETAVLGRYLTAYGLESPYYVPTLHERWSWFVRKHRFNIMPAEFQGSYARFASSVWAEGGYYPESHQYEGSPARQEGFRVDAYALQPIIDVAKKLEAAEIPFVFWMSPLPSDAFSERYLSDASAFLHELGAMAPGILTPQSASPVMGPQWFATRTHATPAGAAINSENLGKALRPILAADAAP